MGMSPEVTPRDQKEVDGKSLKDPAEALNVHSWTTKKAKAPLRLSFEVEGRAAACIRLSASVSGLSVHEVARRCIESFETASKNIATFTELFFNHINWSPTGAEVDAVTAKILEFQKAGHIQGFTPDQLQISIMKALTGEDWETAKLLVEATKLINAAGEESKAKS